MNALSKLAAFRALPAGKLLLLMFFAASSAFAQNNDFAVSSASFLGDASSADRVRGARFLSDGTIVLAANIGASSPGNVAPILLNGATATSGGAILRFSANGRAVLSVTRLAAQVEDLAVDASDNIYVAAWNDGALKLNSTATTVLWAKVGRTLRIDAGSDGTAAILTTAATDPDSGNPGSGAVSVFAANGVQLSTFAGRSNTLDVCVDAVSQTVISIGWRQANAFDGTSTQPVQIAYLRGNSYSGAEKYSAYDWSTDQSSPRFINRPENNMADTRGYRCAIGADNKLYAAFEVAGGNHIFRYSPFDITARVSIVGGDRWHEFYNTRSEHKTFFARFEPATGAYLLGQQLLARLEADDRGNTFRVNRGAIAADAAGNVYIGGESAYGMPIPPHTRFVVKPGETTFNPFPGGYLGGAYLIVMNSNFTSRLYATRLATGGATHAIDARSFGSNSPRFVFAGTTRAATETYTLSAIQPNFAGGTQDGWFSVANAGTTTAAPADVQPILECVRRNAANDWTARFGYLNNNAQAVTIPVGADNQFFPTANRGQTVVFQPGRVRFAFDANFNGKRIAWMLASPNGARRTVAAAQNSPRCQQIGNRATRVNFPNGF